MSTSVLRHLGTAGLVVVLGVSCSEGTVRTSDTAVAPVPDVTSDSGPTAPPTTAPLATAPTTGAPAPTAPVAPTVDLSSFTTLGAAPSLDVVLPPGVGGTPTAVVRQVPGGVLVGVFPPAFESGDGTELPTSSLTVLDHDGTIRWHRSFGTDSIGFAVPPAELAPTLLWVTRSSGGGPRRLSAIDLATGSDSPNSKPFADLVARRRTSRFVLLNDEPAGRTVDGSTRLTVVDLLTGSPVEVPYPVQLLGMSPDAGNVDILDPDPLDAEFVLALSPDPYAAPQSVFVGGSWTNDPSAMASVNPARLRRETSRLEWVDGAGRTVWGLPDFHRSPREGLHETVAGGVVLALRCRAWDESSCLANADGVVEEELVALDAATGALLWTLPGLREIPVAGASTAIIGIASGEFGSPTGGYVQIDLRSGARVDPDATPWPPGAFEEACCGDSDYVFVTTDGAVVAATNRDRIRIWYPPEASRPTVTVSIPA